MQKKVIKINLSLADDVKKAVSSYFTTTDTGISKAVGLIKSLNDASSIFEKALNEAKLFQSLKIKIETSAKDLGIAPTQMAIYSDLNSAIEDLKATQKKADTLKKAIALLNGN